MINELRVGTRGSKLAITQAEIVVTALRNEFPTIEFKMVTIKTKGDIDKRPIFTIDRKGIFEKEINEAVIRNEIDFAVHSLKDIPTDLSDAIVIASIPERSKPNDVLVSAKRTKLKHLQSGAVVGTSSLRRAVQVKRLRPDLDVRPIRGNVETRISRTRIGDYDAIVLAEAGLIRLGLVDRISERFTLKDFVPSPGQGSLGVVCRSNNRALIEILKKIDDPKSRAEFDAERALLNQIGGGCRFPVGAVAVTKHRKTSKDPSRLPGCPVLGQHDSSYIIMYASVYSADGTRSIKLRRTGSVKNARHLGSVVGKSLIKDGVLDLALGWREAVQKWNRI